MLMTADINTREFEDVELSTFADYVTDVTITSDLAFTTARHCLMDSLGCAIQALRYSACTKLLGPVIEGTQVPNGSRVPGTSYVLDPILAAFDIGAMVRWLDFNDTWLAAEWAHPSDNLGAILAVADFVSRKNLSQGLRPYQMKDVLTAMIKAHEIQGILALENSFNRLGFDHVILVKIASTALATYLLGGDKTQIQFALSQAWIDGVCLRAYRHAPNTGARKSWAAGDATSRGVRLAWMTMQGELGYATPLSAPKWGFNDSILKGASIKIPRKLGSYVMENILFKISYPTEFHAQTAAEAAVRLSSTVKDKIDAIDKIVVTTQEPAIRIISKSGPLYNPADRDHSLQYVIATGLLYGDLKAHFYENDFAKDPRIDLLRGKMVIEESKDFSKDYLDPEKRSIANAIQIYFKDGSSSEKVIVEYPLGHRRRREEGIPILFKKFKESLSEHYSADKIDEIESLFHDRETLENMPVNEFMDIFTL